MKLLKNQQEFEEWANYMFVGGNATLPIFKII